MAEQSAEKDAGQHVEEQWGVRLGDSQAVKECGRGYWAMRHAEQEVERIAHNATLPFVGAPRFGTVVRRTVTRYYAATEWTDATQPPSPGVRATASERREA